jgi:gliding motility-associated-like protein
MKRNRDLYISFFLLFLTFSTSLQAQLTAPGSTGSDKTSYPVFQGTDSIFVFCANDSTAKIGTLLVSTQLQGTKTFLWEKYNPANGVFDFHYSESSDRQQSPVQDLPNGCYRVTITLGANTEIHRAWVFNNWISASGTVENSNCESFKLTGMFQTNTMKYYDLATNAELEVFKDMKVQWKDGPTVIATVLSPQIFDVPAVNTDYTFRVYDRFGCESATPVTYESIVTKASFKIDADWTSANKTTGEAPLEVTFTNTSQNGDANGYEWFFFRDLDEIKKESAKSQQPIDSFMVIAFNESPVFTYDNTGTYMVKLVSKKKSEFFTCTDTVYLPDYIYVDSSFVHAPNVFTPNGDGVNDVFGIKFTSMKSMKITIVNRWGKRVHYWEKSDIRGFDDTYEETVWDGKIGGRYASPGVYYYVVEGTGRDDKKRRAHGFVHLFREKD